MRFSYYPGCSAHAYAKEYDRSAREICAVLGIDLQELEDWNCCGSSFTLNTSIKLSRSLSGRNLLLAEKAGADLATLCAFCFNRLKRAESTLKHQPALAQEISDIIGEPYNGKTKVRHLLEILYNDIGIHRIKSYVVRPLTDLKVVNYYGCCLSRPYEIVDFDDPENPVVMDHVMGALGCQCLKWSYKTECCGGSLALAHRDIVARLVNILFDKAREAGADCIVTACPLCFTNLETRASTRNALPVFYFTELIGLAFGVKDAPKWFNRHLISPNRLLREAQLIS